MNRIGSFHVCSSYGLITVFCYSSLSVYVVYRLIFDRALCIWMTHRPRFHSNRIPIECIAHSWNKWHFHFLHLEFCRNRTPPLYRTVFYIYERNQSMEFSFWIAWHISTSTPSSGTTKCSLLFIFFFFAVAVIFYRWPSVKRHYLLLNDAQSRPQSCRFSFVAFCPTISVNNGALPLRISIDPDNVRPTICEWAWAWVLEYGMFHATPLYVIDYN